MWIAYQTWANPSWQSGPRYSRRIYGHGSTPQEARFNATHYERNGETWAYGPGSGHPNANDLSVEEVGDEEVDDIDPTEQDRVAQQFYDAIYDTLE